MISHRQHRRMAARDREQDHGIGCDSLFWALLVVFPLEGSHLLKKFSDGIHHILKVFYMTRGSKN